MTEENSTAGALSPTIVVVGNDDDHAFFRKGLLDKVENNGEWAVSVGDEAFCEGMKWTGKRGVSLVAAVDIADPEAYAKKVWYAQRMAPPYIGLQSPPDRPEVYAAILAALFSLHTSMIVIAFPSRTIEELFDSAGRLVEGLKTYRDGINVIFGDNVSKEFQAAE
jgi:hypothetical protein